MWDGQWDACCASGFDIESKLRQKSLENYSKNFGKPVIEVLPPLVSYFNAAFILFLLRCDACSGVGHVLD